VTDATAGFAALVVRIPAGYEDEAAAALGATSLGVEVRADGGAGSLLRIYVRDRAQARALLERAGASLARAGVPADTFSAAVETVRDERWAERYQASLRPFPIGRRFLIVPGAVPGDAAGRETLVLVPGMAFGTGEHATTRLAVLGLETAVVPGSSWLDVGTGTAILALVAARCGAARVAAVDDDPEAVRVAREVVRVNGVAGCVEVGLGSADGAAGAGHDGLVANIGADYVLRRAADLAAALRPGGLALTTGYLAAEAGAVEAALGRAGLTPVSRASEDGWTLGVSRRATAGI
jgi:ribosomal protein L11 methyltransferase